MKFIKHIFTQVSSLFCKAETVVWLQWSPACVWNVHVLEMALQDACRYQLGVRIVPWRFHQSSSAPLCCHCLCAHHVAYGCLQLCKLIHSCSTIFILLFLSVCCFFLNRVICLFRSSCQETTPLVLPTGQSWRASNSTLCLWVLTQHHFTFFKPWF